MTYFAQPGLAMLVTAFLLIASQSPGIAQERVAPCPPATSAGASPVAGTPASGGVAETSVRVGETDALLWRAGNYGVILSHGAVYDAASWRPQAEVMAAAGTTVLAVEQTTPEDIRAGIEFLTEACGITDVALVGASAGAGAVFAVAASEPEAVDQLIILSATGDVSQLGEQPKLFVASEGEGLAETVRQMAEDAPGTDNEALILPGDAHAQAIFQTEEGGALLRAILDRLDEHRN